MNKQLTIESVKYEVRALTVRDMIEVKKLDDDTPDFDFGLEIAKRAISKNGSSIGDAILDMQLNHFTELSILVNELNGASGKD